MLAESRRYNNLKNPRETFSVDEVAAVIAVEMHSATKETTEFLR
jgi:hypothetical protein